MIEDNPDWQIYRQMLQALYQQNPAKTSIAGTIESIAEISAETLYDCHKAFYTPSNMILTVVGDVEPAAVTELARKILPAEGGPAIQRDYGQEPEAVAMKEARMAMEVSSPPPEGGGHPADHDPGGHGLRPAAGRVQPAVSAAVQPGADQQHLRRGL